MRKNLLAAALGAAALATALPAAAQMPRPSDFYVGAGVGRVDVGETDTAMKVFAGANFTPMIGLEAAYNDLGDYQGTSLRSWSLVGVGTMPLNPTWSVFAKAGVTRNTISSGITEDNTDPMFGLGVGMNLNRNLGARLEYEDFGKTPVRAVGDERISLWSVSVTYSF